MSAVGLVTDGPLLLAAPVAAAAGLLSFLSPCVLPLVPGYLSFVTGLSGEELAAERRARPTPADQADRAEQRAAVVGAPAGVGVGLPVAATAGVAPAPGGAVQARWWGSAVGGRLRVGGRVAAGTGLFVLGFSVVFVFYGAAVGGLGQWLRSHQVGVSQVLGAMTIVMGLAFAGVFSRMSWANREFRIHRLPQPGLLGAPVLGVLFGLGWTPCLGPTLSAVLGLAATSATVERGAFLSAAYCLGLGLPFLAVGLAFRRAVGALRLLRRHARALSLTGGLLLVAIGALQLTGGWADLVISIRPHIPGFSETPL